MKKLWKILLPAFVLCLCVLLLPTKASAATIVSTGTCGEDLTWTLDDEGTLTISGTGTMKDYSWGDSPFYQNSDIKTVVIEEGVTSIGSSALSGCSSLTSVTIPSSVTSIGNHALYGCSSLTGIWVDENNPNYSSDACGVLFDKDKTELLQAPGAITKYVIPDSVTSIGDYAFDYCSSLSSITIPDSVTSIGDDALAVCSSLTGIWVDDNNPNYSSDIYGVLFNKNKTEIIQIPGAIAEYVIPDSVTNIGDFAFYNCSNLTSITIPDSVTSIGWSAFSYCSSLTSITIPDSVTSIGDHAFSSCSSLTGIWVDENNSNYSSDTYGVLFNKEKTELIWVPQVLTEYTIPDSVTSIGSSAFSDCSSLTSITIPDSVTSIDSYVFVNCRQLTDVYYYGTREQWNRISVSDGNSYLTNAALYICVGSGTCGEDLTWLLYDNGVLTISGTGAMANYRSKNSPFYNHDGIRKVILKNGVNSIGIYAFENCSNLTSITIPDSMKGVGGFAFEGCEALTEIYISDLEAWLNIVGGIPYSGADNFYNHPLLSNEKPKNLYLNGTLLTEVVIPDSITIIPRNAFSYCTNLCKVTIPDTVTSIGSEAFKNTGITSISIPNSVTRIDDYAFNGCDSLAFQIYDTACYLGNDENPYLVLVKAFSEDITTCTIHPDTTLVISPAFQNCKNLTEIVVPNKVRKFGGYAFQNCSNLEKIYITDVASWLSVRFHISEDENYNNPLCVGNGAKLYINGELATDLVIPDDVTSITVTAFMKCSSLNSVTISDSVVSIGGYAFANCDHLTTVAIGNGVTNIYGDAFSDCSSLTSVYIGTSVTSIGSSVFSGCNSLTDIYYAGTQAQWESISIEYGNDALTNATIHYGTADADACIDKYNIALWDDLCVKFYLLAGDRDSSELEASAKIGIGNEKIFPLSELTQQDGYWILPVHMSAAQMSTPITVKLTSGETLLDSGVYTIRDYCDTLLADESASEYHALIKEMLNYGAAAQAFFGYESDGAANEGITGAGQTPVPERAPEMSVSGTAGSVRFYGASLVYESKIAVRFYFSGDVSGCTFAIGEQIYTPVAKNGLYYIEVSDILPQNLDKTIAVTVASGEDTLTVSYSPLTYIVRMNTKGSETLRNLMHALYNYHLAARNIFQPSTEPAEPGTTEPTEPEITEPEITEPETTEPENTEFTENHVAALHVDVLDENSPMNLITREAYPGGSTVSFKAYVPGNATWWAVSWTTDPTDVSLYQWAEGMGESMTSQTGKWADYSVTLPDDGNTYYVYFVGAKGEWNGNALLLDDVVITTPDGTTYTENFENGFEDCLFSVTAQTGAHTIVELKTEETSV